MQGRRIADIQRVAGMLPAEALIQPIEKFGSPRRQAKGCALARIVNGKRLADTRRGACDKDLQSPMALR